MGRRPLVRRRWRRGYGVSRPCTARDASQATATTSHATTVPASMQDAFCVPSCPANVPEVSRGRRLPCLMSTSPATGRMAHRVRPAPAARRSSGMAHPCPRGCISRRNSAILAYRANCDLAPGRRHPRAMAAHPRRISTGRLVSQSVGMAPDHAASGQLPHGRYNSAGTKAAPEKSCYHPCHDCANGRLSAPSLPDCRTGRQAAEDAFGRVVTGRRLHSAHHRAAHIARPTNTATARIIVSLARVSSMSGRPGFAAHCMRPAVLHDEPADRRRAAGAVRPHRHDAAESRRRVGIEVREAARRRERRQRVVADALDERLRAEHHARPLPVPSSVRPATSAPWRSAAPRGRPVSTPTRFGVAPRRRSAAPRRATSPAQRACPRRHQRALSSTPTLCSGAATSLSRRVALKSRLISRDLRPSGLRRQPRL